MHILGFELMIQVSASWVCVFLHIFHQNLRKKPDEQHSEGLEKLLENFPTVCSVQLYCLPQEGDSEAFYAKLSEMNKIPIYKTYYWNVKMWMDNYESC